MTFLKFEEKYLLVCASSFERELQTYMQVESAKKSVHQLKLEPLFTHSHSFFKMDANPQRLKQYMDRNVTSCSIMQAIT
jgi:hypothetical protein